MNSYKIVDVPEKMEKFYGKGKMLHPTLEQIERLVETIPKGFFVTIDTLTKQLSQEVGTDVTCPMRTGNALKKMAERSVHTESNPRLPFWRVLRSDHQMIKFSNMEFWAARIEEEGGRLQYKKSGVIKVEVEPNKLFAF